MAEGRVVGPTTVGGPTGVGGAGVAGVGNGEGGVGRPPEPTLGIGRGAVGAGETGGEPVPPPGFTGTGPPDLEGPGGIGCAGDGVGVTPLAGGRTPGRHHAPSAAGHFR
ncbi:hypothetical protein [Frankia sp. AgPm24]|uniref:hypothetical protein n=1 Tax=Frankia sp. AgPm24 TaxID=631128 RepID=UPI0027E38DE8|nr:hypothetical protein [Frankia sp. AgPm24]